MPYYTEPEMEEMVRDLQNSYDKSDWKEQGWGYLPNCTCFWCNTYRLIGQEQKPKLTYRLEPKQWYWFWIVLHPLAMIGGFLALKHFGKTPIVQIPVITAFLIAFFGFVRAKLYMDRKQETKKRLNYDIDCLLNEIKQLEGRKDQHV